MKVSLVPLGLIVASLHFIGAAPISADPEQVATRQIADWQKRHERNIQSAIKKRYSGCTADTIVRRREWGTLSHKERSDYIKAVKCLRQKPGRTTKDYAPGARTRFDDWAAVHSVQTPNIHFSGIFFHWHRYFVWLYEQALRNECGYTGTQPYWDWTIDWEDPTKSTVFDGSPFSLGGNGQAIPHGNTSIVAFGRPPRQIPPGTGGGCIVSGPFANTSTTLGPRGILPAGPDDGLGYNPRCLNRDIGTFFSNQTRPTDVARTISACTDIACFDNLFEIGIHAAAHSTIGGVMSDPYASAGDPGFYMLHAYVDRVWTLWQSIDPANRTNQVWGTSTAFNDPPSPNVSFETTLAFDFTGSQQRLGDMSSTIDGPFCYQYL